jgi:N-acetylglucosaminyldiphosphoundecaprenol N-acetyl-beta-D-mannosaminyltransferase
MPIDAIEMPTTLEQIEAAASLAVPFLISTPNVNFAVRYQVNPTFRDSLLLSDLCLADGMPIVWIARLVGIPISSRVAGSDMFEALKLKHSSAKPLKIFLFGGDEGIAAMAASIVNSERGGLRCVGTIYPGFRNVDELSQDQFIDTINSSGADFLIASLGAEKGQQWLLRNHHRLGVPVRAHLGAVINFQAGSVRRAPRAMRRLGLEWLWRIKQEPHLWIRYWNDGRALFNLMLIYALPLAIRLRIQRLRYDRDEKAPLLVKSVENADSVILSFDGMATASHVGEAVPFFREAVASKKNVIVDFAATRAIDARFLGLLLMLRKLLNGNGVSLAFTGVSPQLKRIVRLNGAAFLFSPGRSTQNSSQMSI